MSKTEKQTQSEAPINKLREAFEFELIDNHAYTAPDLEKKDGCYADDEIQFAWEMAVFAWGFTHGAASVEVRRLDAENKALRGLAATCYAGLGAECNLPENWLDALKAAADGEPFDTEGLLPFTAAEARDETIRQLEAQNKDLRERLEAPAVVPFGFALVPVEPTKEMVAAACRDHGYPGGSRSAYVLGYRSMLAAAKNGGAA
ncbi:hypothetical protein [Delftia tsuruhatensis]|uniref:hypothetical protein n=1 Tax=Delftia tsuruhatensis TaxID=180282 RepID=UPI002091D96B|nr:hypothetical protein [Delftia tsuruhatensis]MCO5338596.1 hypothetical protein [Delftia tsuruhatensis]MCR4546620.1 hypothetical protein [Delftia tsuruhatensis]